MEPGGVSSMPPAPIATWGEPDAGPSSSSLEHPSTDPGKLRALPVGPGAHCGDPASGSPGSQASAGDTGSVSEPSSGAKIPNRDSGIDSPSCSVVGEHFSCEDGSEAGPGPTIKGLHLETAPGGKAPREEADSDMGEGSSEEPDPENSPLRADADPAKCAEPQKLLHIAQELLHTEETYVKRLHLLDQVFCTRLMEAGIPSEVTTGIFSNISSIYCFHGKFLLPELQTRIMNEWDTNPRLGDILQKLAPFLKMYGEYVKNFDRAVELVSTWTQRSPVFKDIVQGIQKQEMCGNLTLQHHMLEPVQRVPRYELLLKDYLKRLPEDAPDWKDAERSLELISTAANHSNAAIRKMEKMHKLLEVYERLGGEEDIVNPANELIKEGHIQKLSAKNGTTQDRHLFLFNSMILYCVPKLRLMGQKFSVREKMDISDLQVQDVVKSNAAYTFIITGKKRSLELQTRTEEEKKEWIQVIEATIEKHKQNSQTFKAFSGSFGQNEDSSLTPDPPMVSANSEVPAAVATGGGGAAGLEPRRGSSKTRRDKEKQGCSSCGETFNSITKRKHHCKLCGAVICGKCSEFKAENGRQSRVCRECFLTQPVAPSSPSLEEPLEPKQSTEKPATVDPPPSLLCGPLLVSDGGTAWSKVWAAISESDSLELVLHLRGGSQDGQLLHAIPLSGCRVSVPDPAERLDAGHMWQLQQAQQSLYLSAPSAELQQQWLEALSSAAHGHLAQASPGAQQPQAPAAP
ncbi:FYVE, RhoGEF and PH domain-containing protein 3 isoform X1 [Monodon monoceros]|uniref:FYVE, RhoGEF and PH domain containing 3 n=1 Tax=Monodon monoceros TaxID=40151 RepID=A0A8C6F8A5_MONMO|nr:FYVE, RhoGEF and PH domain-containing protein 3 isoform X1 [Monodon monoceros]XP_029057760.1 FYVE, RhoGEF and PH domain-containing protein 3 isoform X1 [Monodon monoceros]XP_029057761.1 FYVE, RhoGEF and PH domain-containing protein 3 isoform X1 [Monodon monoceros]XP_029057762.1 FYVE, RhoGEF and PH domain-containing protein 3 isoform X1 [Monodon monoceros]XP_029057764.1 FYVE, RhoGEF and PH domain-containing protein 3 isoform X1 [Monodon monoceros]